MKWVRSNIYIKRGQFYTNLFSNIIIFRTFMDYLRYNIDKDYNIIFHIKFNNAR